MRAAAGTTPPSVSNQEIDAFFEVSYQLSHLARRRLQVHLAAYNLTPPQYTAMRTILNHQNDISVSALAKAVYQVTPTITGILNRLEQRGLIIRRRSTSDRRHQLVSITPSGKEILDQINADIHRLMGALLTGLNPRERDALLDSINALSALLESPTSME